MKKRVRKYEYQYKKEIKKVKTNDEYAEEGVKNMKLIMERHNHLNKK